MAIVWWPLYASIVSAEIRACTAARTCQGGRDRRDLARRLVARHLLPGAVHRSVIAASLDVGGLILTVSGLSFLGLGAPAPAPELGAMTAQGMPYTSHVRRGSSISPALAIFVIALASNLAGDSIRELLEDSDRGSSSHVQAAAAMIPVLLGLTAVIFILEQPLADRPGASTLGPSGVAQASRRPPKELWLDRSLPQQYVHYLDRPGAARRPRLLDAHPAAGR